MYFYSRVLGLIDDKKTHELIGEGGKYQALLLESNKSLIKKLQMNGLIEACETAMSRNHKEFFDFVDLVLFRRAVYPRWTKGVSL